VATQRATAARVPVGYFDHNPYPLPVDASFATAVASAASIGAANIMSASKIEPLIDGGLIMRPVPVVNQGARVMISAVSHSLYFLFILWFFSCGFLPLLGEIARSMLLAHNTKSLPLSFDHSIVDAVQIAASSSSSLSSSSSSLPLPHAFDFFVGRRFRLDIHWHAPRRVSTAACNAVEERLLNLVEYRCDGFIAL
jgi:hypothetical protein